MKEERYDKILEILEEEKFISVQSLSEKLYVSLPTIRRDLGELQRRNLVVRSHGGAKKVQGEHIVAPLNFRKTVHVNEKKRLCRAATGLISDNDIVFIDASTTTMQIAEFLGEKKMITVVTNGITLACHLVKKGIKTYCTGGEIFENSLAQFGPFAEDFLRRFNFDLAIFSCHGVNEKGILTDPSLPETQIRRTALQQAKKSVFLCDETKLNLSTPYNLIPIWEVDFAVTDTPLLRTYLPEGAKTKIIVV